LGQGKAWGARGNITHRIMGSAATSTAAAMKMSHSVCSRGTNGCGKVTPARLGETRGRGHVDTSFVCIVCVQQQGRACIAKATCGWQAGCRAQSKGGRSQCGVQPACRHPCWRGQAQGQGRWSRMSAAPSHRLRACTSPWRQSLTCSRKSTASAQQCATCLPPCARATPQFPHFHPTSRSYNAALVPPHSRSAPADPMQHAPNWHPDQTICLSTTATES